MNDKTKITVGATMGFIFFCIAKAFGQTNATPLFPNTPDFTGNVIVAIWSQAVNNPSSFSVILFLMVVAWLCDDLPFINSKYVKHITVIAGASLYWAFADPSTVAKIYPHPLAIFLSNGSACGAFAYVAHWQVVSRLRDLFEKRKQTENPT